MAALQGDVLWKRAIIVLAAAVFLTLGWVLPPFWVMVGGACVVAVGVTLRYPVAGFVLLAFAVPWMGGLEVGSGSVAVSPVDALVGLIGFVWLARLTQNRREGLKVAPWTPWLVLFVVVISASATQALDSHASLREIAKWVELIVVYHAGTALVRNRRDVSLILGSVVLAGVSQAVLGYIQSALQLGPAAFTHALALRAYGTFDQPNPYAGYLNVVFAVALALSYAEIDRRWRMAARVSVVSLLVALLASQSRGALLATVVAFAVVSSFHSRHMLRLSWLATLCGVVGSWLVSLDVVPVSPFERVLTAVGLGNVSFGAVNNSNFSAVERAAHWLAGVRMFSAHPLLGVGIGNYAQAYPVYHPRGWYAPLAHAHNYYINVGAEAGIFGLAAYLLLAGSALWYSYAAFRRCQDAVFRAAALGTFGALVATNFHNLFDVLYVHGMVVLLGVLVAIATVGLHNSDVTALRVE